MIKVAKRLLFVVCMAVLFGIMGTQVYATNMMKESDTKVDIKDIAGVYDAVGLDGDYPTLGILGMEVREDGVIYIHGGQFWGTKCNFLQQDGISYIQVEEEGLIGDEGTLYVVSKTNIDGKECLILKDKDNKETYWEKTEQPTKTTVLGIDDSGEIVAIGDFKLNEKLTFGENENPCYYFGSIYRWFGSCLNIREDGTGYFHIGIGGENIRFVQQDGKAYMMIVDKEHSIGDAEGTEYLIKYCELNGKKYLVMEYHELNCYWEPIDNEEMIRICGVYRHRR